ncbi:hypothetical protein RSOLAG22IIIB_07966 [Rhizoctonia solani]|uniref:Uncharacterized protein n=1 Tax=Rhizoctonia solani TaxID=456999 RepID=A0A0K6FR69_9AGAM|nr:hypothetical protein RSOLAG22IIIB_07966 [Rhizoctonia solani]
MVRTVPQHSSGHATMDDYNRSWLHSQSQLTTYGHTRTYQPLGIAEHLQTASATRLRSLHMLIQALYARIPPSVDVTQTTHFEQIVHEYQLKRADYWLQLPPPPIASALLAAPKLTIWILYLGAKLIQAIDGNMHSRVISKCIDWVDKLEPELGCEYRNNMSPNGLTGWLSALLPLVFLKFTTIGCSSGYFVLQKALPVFLQLAAIDSELHIEHPHGNLVISFPRTLGAPECAIQWFVVYDTIASMLLGIPPLVEYGYDNECKQVSPSHSFEWLHGIPSALIGVISQVNSWRAGSRVTPLDDWQKLETCALGWQSQLAAEDEAGYNLTVKLAIQEGWRHVTLIYIYMAMCGVSSHDTRVQESIEQIIRLGKAVDNLPIGVHILPHCVVVGLVAKYEKHRSIVHKKLLSFKGTQVWLFQGSEFGRVLEHLWYGVGAGGAPVTWDDYVQSRRAVVPI